MAKDDDAENCREIVTRSPEGELVQYGHITRTLIRESSDKELSAICLYIDDLLEIRASEMGRIGKVRSTYAVTANKDVIVSAMKFTFRELKRIGWDDRQNVSRAGILGAGIAVATVGGQAAGLAAFGGAIAVPLWIVFGAGAMFAETMRAEIFAEIRGRLHEDTSSPE